MLIRSIIKLKKKYEIQQIALNLLLDIEFEDFYKSLQKYTAKSYSCFLIDATLASDNLLRLRRIFWKNMNRKIDDKIRDEKLRYDINREAAKISALSSGKLVQYQYLTGTETLPPG